MEKRKKCKCSNDRDKMLSARRLDTLAELDKVIEEMAGELLDLRIMRAGLRKVVNGEKAKKVKSMRKKGKGYGEDI